MGTFAKSQDPDDSPGSEVCYYGQNISSEKETQHFWKIITCDPSIYTTNYPDLTVSNFRETPNGLQRVKPIARHQSLWTHGRSA